MYASYDTAREEREDHALREVALEDMNDHIVEVTMRVSLQTLATEEAGRHLMEAERQAHRKLLPKSEASTAASS